MYIFLICDAVDSLVVRPTVSLRSLVQYPWDSAGFPELTLLSGVWYLSAEGWRNMRLRRRGDGHRPHNIGPRVWEVSDISLFYHLKIRDYLDLCFSRL